MKWLVKPAFNPIDLICVSVLMEWLSPILGVFPALLILFILLMFSSTIQDKFWKVKSND